MKIGIDARLIEETGVGRYIRNLIKYLGVLDKKNNYVVFLRKKSYTDFVVPNNRWGKRVADVAWHSISEQFIMPWLLIKEHLDLVHIPYFNVPIFYPGNFIVTIHDLTILHFDTGKATTLPLFFYKLRRLGYYVSLAVGLVRAKAVIAVSETTKKEIMDHFQISPEKVTVTYEGVDEKVKSLPAGEAGQESRVKSEKPIIKCPYFLYVGNAYPHKNLDVLIHAFHSLIKQPEKVSPFQAKLVLVGKDDYFYRKVRKLVHAFNLDEKVVFFRQATDAELFNLYSHALALVLPSFMEGFGLPPLEAIALGCPVICSDIPIFHEILGDIPRYFDPGNHRMLADELARIAQSPFRPDSKKSRLRIKQYDWNDTARKTLDLYRASIHAAS